MYVKTLKYLNKEILETESPINIDNDGEKTYTKIYSICCGLTGIKICSHICLTQNTLV